MRYGEPPPCHCSSYGFPHRCGSGKCDASFTFTYHLKIEDGKGKCDDLCQACGQPSDTHEEDVGIGDYEFWGARGTHVDWQVFSDCCDAPMVPNTLKDTAPFRAAWKERSCQTSSKE